MKKNVIKSRMFSDWPKGKPLFKYMKKEHADKLFNSGELHIGTLYDFRDEEKYGQKRGDEGEGKKEICEHINDITVKDSSQSNRLSDFSKQYIRIEDTAKNTRLVNVTVSELHDSPDCYIYCMSKNFDERLYEKFQADVCVKLKSPYKFVHSISIALRECAGSVRLSSLLSISSIRKLEQFGLQKIWKITALVHLIFICKLNM